MVRTKQTIGYRKRIDGSWAAPGEAIGLYGKAPKKRARAEQKKSGDGKSPVQQVPTKKAVPTKKSVQRYKKSTNKTTCQNRGAVSCKKIPGCRVVIRGESTHCRPIIANRGQRQVCGMKKLDKLDRPTLLLYAKKYYTKPYGSGGKPMSRMNKGELCAFIKDYRNLNDKYFAKYDSNRKPPGKLPVDIAKGKY
jgi:hypothetical protein